MLETRWARESESPEIIEFIDYVFSKAHRPHDFASLLPKLYGEKRNSAQHHFIMREDGKLMAAILCWPMEVHMKGERLTVLGIGSVSTHPAVRGKGYLKQLMDAADQKARNIGADFAVLSGLRQRYERFGYVYGGCQMNAKLIAHNVRHALADVKTKGWTFETMQQDHVKAAMALNEKQPCFCKRGDEMYLDCLRSWNNQPFALLKDGHPVGFGALRRNEDSTHIAELLLENEADFSTAMKMLFEIHGTLSVSAAAWQRERVAWLAKTCQDFTISKNHAYKIYRPEHVKKAFAALGFESGGFEFDGFGLPLPLYVSPPDCV